MKLFLSSFLLPVAAGVVLLIFTNPMNFDWTQRITLLLAIAFSAYFLAHTMTKRAGPGSPSVHLSQPETSESGPTAPDDLPLQPPQSAPPIQQSTSGAGSVAIVGDGNVVETNAPRNERRLQLQPTSMQIQVGTDLFQAPSIKITNIGDVGVTIAEAGCVVTEDERHEIKGLRAEGRLNRSWPYHLSPAESADAYLYPADLGPLAGKEILEVYVETGDGERHRVNDQSELAEFIRAVDQR